MEAAADRPNPKDAGAGARAFVAGFVNENGEAAGAFACAFASEGATALMGGKDDDDFPEDFTAAVGVGSGSEGAFELIGGYPAAEADTAGAGAFAAGLAVASASEGAVLLIGG